MKIKFAVLALIALCATYVTTGDNIESLQYKKQCEYSKKYDDIIENGIRIGTCIGAGIGVTLGTATCTLFSASPTTYFFAIPILTAVCGGWGYALGGVVGFTRVGCYVAVRSCCPVRHPQKECLA